MKLNEFKKILKNLKKPNPDFPGTQILDLNKISSLDDETKNNCVYFIVRHRLPIVKEFISSTLDKSWLHAMGYLYETKGLYSDFVHTAEQRITPKS